MTASEQLLVIAQEFSAGEPIREIREFGDGNVNDTYFVALHNPQKTGFILQRLNTSVFPKPAWVMSNMRQVTQHVRRKLARTPLRDRNWQIPEVILTSTGADHYQTTQNQYWRAISFIPGTVSINVLENPRQSVEIGWALGTFHQLMSNFPVSELADTLPGFHITPEYLSQYDAVIDAASAELLSCSTDCQEYIARQRKRGDVLESALARGELSTRPIHGDPKINNVLFSQDSQLAIAMIDLDTVKPGLIHYDIGDCLRSGCNLLGEETHDWEAVTFDLASCRQILQGYLTAARDFLTPCDRKYLLDSVWLIAFELGLRFYSDFLAGNVYFRFDYPEHNLNRARVQFQLARSIDAQATAIQTAIEELT